MRHAPLTLIRRPADHTGTRHPGHIRSSACNPALYICSAPARMSRWASPHCCGQLPLPQIGTRPADRGRADGVMPRLRGMNPRRPAFGGCRTQLPLADLLVATSFPAPVRGSPSPSPGRHGAWGRSCRDRLGVVVAHPRVIPAKVSEQAQVDGPLDSLLGCGDHHRIEEAVATGGVQHPRLDPA
jgi:hypothetical protein